VGRLYNTLVASAEKVGESIMKKALQYIGVVIIATALTIETVIKMVKGKKNEAR